MKTAISRRKYPHFKPLVDNFLRLMAVCNEPCAPKKKRPRLRVRFQMELNFSNYDEEHSFLIRLENVKRYFSSRSSRSLDNRELLQCLLDLVDDEEGFEPAESSRDDHVKSMLNCSGKSCILYYIFLISS